MVGEPGFEPGNFALPAGALSTELSKPGTFAPKFQRTTCELSPGLLMIWSKRVEEKVAKISSGITKIGLQLKADLENLTDLHPVGEDFRWYIKAKCNNCGEVTHEFVYVCALEKVALKGSRGEGNLVMKCRFCGRENNMIDIVPGSLQSYNAEDSGNFKTVVAFLCRGVEPTAFDPRAGWCAKGADTSSKFEEVDLTDLDWSDFDEKSNETVGVYNLESRFVKLK